MKVELSSRMVRSYKGAAASILLLFLIERRPLTQGEMRRGSGYGDEAINDAVWMLREDGLIAETTRYTWALLDGMQQLPLGSPALPAENNQSYPQGYPQGETQTVDKTTQNEPEIDLAPDDPELALNESMNESDRDSNEDDSLIDSTGRSGKTGAGTPCEAGVNREDLAELGFYGRGLEEMLQIPGLTLGEVRYQVEHAPSLGAALARIRKRQPVPGLHSRDGPISGNEYISGEFADFIQH